jgi:sugar lactone lactonase YvrE/enterochelin esterase-like enzyme
MPRSLLAQFITLVLIMTAAAAAPRLRAQEESYPEHPDSVVQDGVPQGKIEGPINFRSNIFPGTVREYWIYVPAQYDANKPTPVFVVQDGLDRAKDWKLTTALDNLIHKGDVPAQIGIFVSPGVVPAANENALARFNRSYEYDGLGDQYARFLIEELLPEVAKSYNLSNDPNDRAIAGASSGAICAFNVAWERPDQFRRVISTIGTFVSLRGGNDFPALIRKTENKPIRVFLQDGKNDLDIFGGSWWAANQDMLAAFNYAGYDVDHAWGEGGHSGKHGAAIMPDMLRFIWRGYPEPIVAGRAKERRIEVLLAGEDWELVSEGHQFTEGPAVNEQGEVFFTDIPKGQIFRVALDGHVSVFAENTPGINGLMFGPDGKLYGCQGTKNQIVRYDADGKEEVLIEDAPCNDLVVLASGSGYYTDPTNKKVWRFSPDGTRAVVDEGIGFPNGIIVSPDQTLLTVSDTYGRYMYSFQIQPDGSLAFKQPDGHLHRGDASGATGADGMTVDTEGRYYVTTSLGVQVLDQMGRVHFIIAKPQQAWLANVVFGGPELNYLYATCQDKVYRRKLAATGAVPSRAPFKPTAPRL